MSFASLVPEGKALFSKDIATAAAREVLRWRNMLHCKRLRARSSAENHCRGAAIVPAARGGERVRIGRHLLRK